MTIDRPNVPTKTPAKMPGSARKLTIGTRLREAIRLMIWENRTDNEAAVAVKMHVTAIRKALHRPHVSAFLKEQRQVFHTRELARNSHTLVDVRDKSSNGMARIAAVRELERAAADGATGGAPGSASRPGITIVIAPNMGALAPSTVIDITPSVSETEDRDR